jgi:N-acetyltransferase
MGGGHLEGSDERRIVMAAASGLGSTFDSQPALKGDLVELRPLRPSDYEDLYRVACDPLLWEQHPDNNRHEAQVFRKFFDEALTSGGALLVIDTRTQRVIGSSRFHGYDKDRSEVEIGWTFLARSHWGGKYNRELKQLMLGHAFRFVQSVIFLVGLQNFRSQRALEKIGAVRAGQRPNAIGRDSYVYQITAAEFAQCGV